MVLLVFLGDSPLLCVCETLAPGPLWVCKEFPDDESTQRVSPQASRRELCCSCSTPDNDPTVFLPLLSSSHLLLSLRRTTICNLYTMPRIPEPVWLAMMSGTPEKNQLCNQFMRELALLMEQASKNQFSEMGCLSPCLHPCTYRMSCIHP